MVQPKEADEQASVRENLDREERGVGRALAIVSDLIDLSGLPVPGRGVLARAIADAVGKKRAAARDVFLEEIRSGDVDLEEAVVHQIDEAAAIMLRYLRAADEGVRVRNLRLLARAFRRQLGRGEANAESFQQTAAAIENLSDAELRLLGAWFSFDPNATLFDLREYLGIENESEAQKELYATASSMLRAGLLIPGSAWSGIAYDLSPVAIRLMNDLEAADFPVSKDAG